jgi:hypothetical protein
MPWPKKPHWFGTVLGLGNQVCTAFAKLLEDLIVGYVLGDHLKIT